MKQLTINHLAVLVSIVVLFALGFVWYGPLFGDPWMAMVGLEREALELHPPGASTWLTNIIATVVPVYVLAWLFTKLNVETALAGAGYGLLIAFAFNHLPGMSGGMFAQEPYGLSWITGGFNMVAMAVAGLILGAWRKYK